MEAINKETGEVMDIDPEDIDYLLSEFQEIKEQEMALKDMRRDIERKIAEMASTVAGDSKTKRVAGEKYTAKVTFKEYTKWDVKILNTISDEIGKEKFQQYFRVGEYKPNLKEFKKLSGTYGEAENLYKAFLKAREITPGQPRVELEKNNGSS